MSAVSGSGSRKSLLSSRLFVVALAMTILAVAGGSLAMWQLHAAALDRADAAEARIEVPDGAPLRVAVGRTPGGPAEWVAYAKVFARLQNDLGRPVVLHYELDSQASADDLAEGSADIALVSTGVYLELEERQLVTLVAAPVIRGRSSDAAVLVVSAQSKHRTFQDLKGREVLLAPDALSGKPFLRWLFRGTATDPEQYFRLTVSGGSQDTNLTHVANGQADAACARRPALTAWPDGTFHVIAQSAEFGMAPIVAHRDLDQQTVDAVRQSLLAVADAGILPEGSALEGFAQVTAADYDFARVLQQCQSQTSCADCGQGCVQ